MIKSVACLDEGVGGARQTLASKKKGTAEASIQSPRVRVGRVALLNFFSAHETCTCTSTVEQYINIKFHFGVW